ncbi:hypothetical protein F5880DRAFT_1589670 [Lentinula raphanica]|nr:hypothetical protein F5880DRAFT_1589670 [Lentinula raphanica]
MLSFVLHVIRTSGYLWLVLSLISSNGNYRWFHSSSFIRSADWNEVGSILGATWEGEVLYLFPVARDRWFRSISNRSQ